MNYLELVSSESDGLDAKSQAVPVSNICAALVINADDWGRDSLTTDRTLDCIRRGTVSAASAMVFMEDSNRAAAISREFSVDVGLHLNLTFPFTSVGCDSRLLEAQQKIARYLMHGRLAQVVFHPRLVRAFEYVVRSQIDEFDRQYGQPPKRIDGHHHMHLCENVVRSQLLPAGTLVRRNFTFERGEKSLANRVYRSYIDHRLARRHLMVDYFFYLPPLEPVDRLQQIIARSRESVVELESHPVNPAEYEMLMGDEFLRRIGDPSMVQPFPIARLVLRKNGGVQ